MQFQDPFGLFSFFALFFFAGIVHIIGMILAIVDLLRREDADVLGNSQLIWVVLVLFLPFAWVAYFFLGRR